MQPFRSKVSACVLSASLLLSGCTSTLVRDDVKRTAGLNGHCAGSEWVDDSSIAVLPVPIVAFITPQVDLHHVASEPYLAGLSRIITLGVWQWCPARVTWSADVLADPPRPASGAIDGERNTKS
jgi:hypothetical protein